MKIMTLFMVCVCFLIAAPVAWGQAANNPAKSGILGYLDPRTGAFRPVPAAAQEDSELPALATFSGTITVTLTITVKSTGLSTFECTATTTVIDAGGTLLEETNTVAASGSGTTRTCKLTIPYSWSLATQSTDTMSTSYSVFAGAGTNGLPQRTSSRSPLDSRKVPANGATTALTASVTI